MICQKCGAKFPDNTTKCPNCGAEYAAENTVTPVTDTKTVKKIIITFLIAVILIAGGVTAAVILSEGSSVSVNTFDMLQLADRYLKEMNYEQAIVEFRKILEIEPKNVDAYIGLADAYVALGDNDKAIEVLERAREIVDNEKRIEDKLAEVSMIFESKTETAEPGTESVNTSITQPAEPIAETTVTIAGVEYSVADTTELSIKNTILSFDNLENIGKLINLKKLSLSGNQISDITPLAGLTNLTDLLLWFNQISDIPSHERLDITPLAGLTNLTGLRLNVNQISETQIEQLKAQLPNCKIN